MNTRLLKAVAKWRAQYNPLRGLTFQRAVGMLEEGERGAYADLQWLYRYIEKRDPTLRGLKRLRLAAISKLDWDIKVVPPKRRTKAWERRVRNLFGNRAPDQIAEEQANALRDAYDRIDNLKQAIAFLALAEFRGFSHLEKIYERDKPALGVVRLDPVPQWHWCRDTLYGPWQYDPQASSGRTSAQPIDTRHFIIREIDDPINEIGLIVYLRKNLSQKDWDGFVESYGIPPLFAEMPPNTPPGKEDEYQQMAEAVVSDMRGTLPSGAKIHTVDVGARGHPFREHLNYQDEQLVLAGTSGKLTMLNGPTGLGSGQGEVHQDTFDELAQAEASEISELFQKQFDRAVLDAAGFEGLPALAYFELAAQDKTDVGAVLEHALKATQAGYQMDPGELAEKTGYKLVVRPPSPGPGFGTAGYPPPTSRTNNRASPVTPDNPALLQASVDRIARTLAERLAPVREKLQGALDAKDDAAFDAALADLKRLKNDAATLLRQAGAGDALVQAFEQSYGTALLDGAATAAQAQTRNRGPILNWLRTLFHS
jgi:phage gp29-like protein